MRGLFSIGTKLDVKPSSFLDESKQYQSSQTLQQWQYFQSARPNYDHPNRTVQRSLVPEPGQSVTARLVSAESGDILTVQVDGRRQQLRLCGINAPHLGQPGAEESRKYLQSKIDQANGNLIFVPI